VAVGAWWRHTSQPDYRLRQARQALLEDDPEEAERAAARLEADGYEDLAHQLRAEVLFHRRRYADALSEINQVRDPGDRRVDALALSGQCLLRLGNVRRAERVLAEVVRERPDHADAHRGLAALYFDQGATDLAISHLTEVARLDPADARPHRTMGMIYKDTEDNTKAIACYREALRRGGLSARVTDEVREELARCLVDQRGYGQALEILEPCAPRPPVLVLRAECLWGEGRAAEARPLVERALKLAPQSIDGLLLRGKLFLEAGQPREAARDLEAAVKSDPHDYTCRYQLGLAYDMLGRRADAAEQHRLSEQNHNAISLVMALKEEAQRNPWDPNVRRRLAALYRQLDNPEQAAVWQQAAAACAAGPRSAPPPG
jgi:tetratricopeptide (TPR) repeat protein